MSLDKAINSGKEHRRQYRRPKLFDPQCRNHGNCPWCQGTVKYKKRKSEMKGAPDER